MSGRRNDSPLGYQSSGSNNGMLPPGSIPMDSTQPMPPPPAMVSHTAPVVLPPPGGMHPNRYAPQEQTSPEMTQPPNPLQQLMYQQQQQDAQAFLRQFLTNSGQHPGPPQRSSSMGLPVPPPPSSMPLMTPIQPSSYHPRVVPPPMLQTMQVPVPPFTAPPSIPLRTTSLPTGSVQESSGPLSPRRRGPPPGTAITSEYFEHHTGHHASPNELEVTPITIYASTRRSRWGNMIAINEHFISYPIRNGLIRVLGQSSADRLLLREHEKFTVEDVAFFGPRSDLYLTAGSDGKVVVYRIIPEPLSHQVVQVLYAPAQRALWHPFDWNKIAIVCQDTVYITGWSHVSSSTNSEDGLTHLQPVSVQCSQTTSQINDIVFSPCGRHLVTGGMDGFVHMYNVGDAVMGSAAPLLHRFEPFDGGDVWSVRFFGGEHDATGLLIGGEDNSKLSLWEAPLYDGAQPTCVQTVKIVSNSSNTEPSTYDVHFDGTTQYLFVADRTGPFLFVLHLASSGNPNSIRRFDNITEFNVTYPILSAALLNRMPTEESDGFTMQMFTVQTQSIQRYNIPTWKCYRPSTSTITAAGADATEAYEGDEEGEELGQSVGALTTEEESEEPSFQAPAESPRATAAAPETEIDVQTHPQQNGDEESEYTNVSRAVGGVGNVSLVSTSPALSPRQVMMGNPPHIITTHGDASSVTGEERDVGASVRSYARSSPSSSVRAYHDDLSQVGELSVDESVGGSDQIMAYLRRMEANQSQREERARVQMQKMILAMGTQISAQASEQVEKTVQKQIQTILVPAMGRIVLHTMENNFMKPVQASFESMINERLIPDMEAKISESLQTSMPETMENSMEEMIQRIVGDVRAPVHESFRKCFETLIIPSFQAATQKMFEQIQQHVVKGAINSIDGARQASRTDVSEQLQQLVGLVDGLSKKIDQLGTDGSVVINGETAEEQQLAMHKTKVQELLNAKDYEEAFKYALGAQNVSLVAFTCHQCESRDVLSSRPSQLSQMIVLCLVQQLGADLLNELPVKLMWLREALLVMNPSDVSIASFVTSVLQELQTSLNVVPPVDRDSQYTLVHHILNSLLSSA